MKKPEILSTSQIAQAAGIHPNTVRLYEAWGYLPPVPRAPNGYRQFTSAHLEQVRLVRLALRGTWLGGELRQVALAMIQQSAAGNFGGALERALCLQSLIHAEQAQAEAAVNVLERWAYVRAIHELPLRNHPLLIGPTAHLLNVTIDRLRDWERNGLITVPRDPHSGYRLYGQSEIERLRVIRTLRRARYSTMSILRMLLYLDETRDNTRLRAVLDTPRPEDDVYMATDHWLTTVRELVQVAAEIVAQVQKMVRG